MTVNAAGAGRRPELALAKLRITATSNSRHKLRVRQQSREYDFEAARCNGLFSGAAARQNSVVRVTDFDEISESMTPTNT